MVALRCLLKGATARAGTFGRQVPEAVGAAGARWEDGSPGLPPPRWMPRRVSRRLHWGGGNAPYVIYESNGWAGWSYLGGIIAPAPAVAMNFDARLEIFGIGTDGNIYHDWQVSDAGAWSGWAWLGTPSNSGSTNGADMIYFASDADDEAYYASTNGAQCSAKTPNLWRGMLNTLLHAWPCGGVANTSFIGFDRTKPLVTAMQHWNDKISDWYAQYFNGQDTPNPAFLAFESGGPQSIVTKRTCDTCIPGGSQNTYGRGQNTNEGWTASGRLASVEIDIINGVNNQTALKFVFAHEIGHTFGLADCFVNAPDANGNPLYDCTKTVMASGGIVGGNGWDSTAKNAVIFYQPSSQSPGYANPFELLTGPSSCDMQTIDQNLPDYRDCPVPGNDSTTMVPDCTDGSALGIRGYGRWNWHLHMWWFAL